MIHNGISSKAPYYDEAVRVEVSLFSRAYIWRPAGTDERWLIPFQWVTEERDKRGRAVYRIDQDGALGGRLISLPRDEISVVR